MYGCREIALFSVAGPPCT